MQVSEIDNVKIYNLSAGKSLPEVSSSNNVLIASNILNTSFGISFSGFLKEKEEQF